ncbi:MAG: CocE/NonD family hydrolase, partial [Candidatus Lokiarchaeota archaeon]|nr:CocE/NonD family hydrolase [Candidatus Lokiarchaeota archaeon]
MHMNVFNAFLLFFAGEDYWDLNIYVAATLMLLLCVSIAFQAVHGKKRDTHYNMKPGQAAWFIIKIILVGALSFASIKIAIAIGIYMFMAMGLASARLATNSERRIWKANHGTVAVVFLLLVPAALIAAGVLLRFWFELMFGIAGGTAFIIAHAGALVALFRKANGTGPARDRAPRGMKDAARGEKVAVVAGVCLLTMAILTVPVSRMTVETVMIPMRDGTRLATTVYRPAIPTGGMPTILIRTPYSRALVASWGESWFSKGYAVVIQDVRGTYDSEGTFDALVSGGADAYDTCAWIVNQSWSDGRIGTTGGSALGITQYFAAGAAAPGLVAQSIQVGTADMYDSFFRGGKYAQSDIGYWIWLNSHGSNATIDAFLAHPEKNAWWNNASLGLDGDYANVSTRAVHVGGWFDIFQQNTIDAFVGYYYNGSDRARRHQKLVMGPWGHATSSNVAGQISYPGGKDVFSARWSDAILAESLEPAKLANGLLAVPCLWNEPNIAYYVMGDVMDPHCSANECRYANDWP